jgi:hypothetical protein
LRVLREALSKPKIFETQRNGVNRGKISVTTPFTDVLPASHPCLLPVL